MAVSDKEKTNIKESVYADEKAYRDALKNALKHQDVQKAVFHSWFKGAVFSWLSVVGAILALWITRSLPAVGDILNIDFLTG